MIVPTAQNLKIKFPEFAQLDDGTVEFAIEEAALFVDDGWIPDTQTLGIYYLAAHRLMISQMAAMSSTGQVVQSERMGEMSITYANMPMPSAAVDVSDYSLTWYGRRYMELAHINNPPIAVI